MITLTDIKQHLRLDLNPDSEADPELQRMLDAAMDHVSQYLNRPVPWTDESSSEDVFPASVQAGVLLIVGDLYENREGATNGSVITANPTVERLLHMYRVGLGV
jgi:hypothetical protein